MNQELHRNYSKYSEPMVSLFWLVEILFFRTINVLSNQLVTQLLLFDFVTKRFVISGLI